MTLPRRRQQPILTIPEKLVELAQREAPNYDAAALASRLASTGVTSIEPRPDEAERPEAIAYQTPGHSGWVDVLYEEWTTPIVTALEELAVGLAKYDQLNRLHTAMIDMELVAEAARELAEAREGDVMKDRYRLVSEPLEVGIFAMYARSFTGRAAIGARWRPLDPDDRRLHDDVVAARSTIHVHADWNPQRSLVDTNAMAAAELGDQAPSDLQPVFGEVRHCVAPEILRAIADMCERQYARLYEETYRLKVALGFPVWPPPASDD